ncbi:MULTISPECIES: dipeptide/oligopeptide/nickel ABC transporter permease/ATP-binding protein [unclassified Microbacterium]|uniref:dipeptide/oligopeptide/nickel ABC transporter permease/ATP-binding protein n=1 Tax=unclassified Microbacterium TaxID=2609290 RepID=UPI001AC01DCB|nr:dipeptide/oligopeptide/nickel ABC transporter permease/ATP-binding protein [Microbacterium sp.]MBN9156487.1 ATP-binding cassette domain-containing protein [Microbacterium sp.]MBS1897522.1 ATP-binding cassette domain-containing protein [Actinomycetota bacterium]MBS1898997.1 ATP-binding cassette domain-containing protein [Actinomycetota bacterium]
MTTTDIRVAFDRARQRRRSGLFRRFLRHPGGYIPLGIFVLIVLVGVAAPLLAPMDPNFVDLAAAKAPPSAAHLLGADSTGRDILSRLIYGTRVTIWGALITIVTAVVIGVPTGVAAGYFRGPFDRIAMWVSDALQSIPGMIILLVVAAGSRNNFELLMVTVGVFMVPGYFRIARSQTMSVREEPYIDAARVSGLSDARIISRHVVTAVYPPVIIQTALTAGMAMGMQAGLQFLGIGDSNVPSWGAMMLEGFRLMLTYPLMLLWPSVALGLTIAVLAIMGSTLAELAQVRTPRLRRRGAKGADAAVEAAPATGTVRHAAEASALRVENLRVSHATPNGVVEVVHGVTLDVAPGEVVGIVGESGSGKSQTVFSVLDLLPASGASTADAIRIAGQDVTTATPKQRQALLGRELGYVPQEPMSNLDPSYTIGHQLIEPLRRVHGMSAADAKARAREVLLRVGLADPDRVLRSYPHQVSGGMAQRVLIAGAISGRPSILIADEPTTALDVTVQAEVLELLRELQQEYGMALLIVTHNFGVVADICDRVIVMRGGEIVEQGDVDPLFAHPQQPYTRELIAASLDDAAGRAELDAEGRAGLGTAGRVTAGTTNTTEVRA